MENKSHAFLAGLFVILLGLAAAAAIYWFGGQREATHRYVVVSRQNVNGLNPQAQVRYRGIRVGKVTGIRLDAKDPRDILIGIEVNAEVPVTRGTTARLAYQGVTGIAHVLLEDTGKDNTPLTAAPGGEPPRLTMTPSLLEELSVTGTALLAEVKTLLKSAQDVLNEDNKRKLAAILGNLEAVSGKAVPALENLDGVLRQTRQILNEDTARKLNAAVGEAGPLLAETRRLMVELQGSADRLNGVLGDSGGGVAALVPRLGDMAGDISAASKRLDAVLKQIEARPQSLVFGAPAAPPGPGEPGFVPPADNEVKP